MEGRSERFVELDIIRFFAALSVMVYHYKSKYIQSLGSGHPELAHSIYAVTKFGYLGVDLFFIISGFVIFASAMGRTSFQFAVSRITRIYPTLWVCVTFTALVLVATPGPASGIDLKQWLANLTLMNKTLGIDYIDGVYWTLQIEIEFYLCVFLLLAADLLKHYRIWLPLWLSATALFLFFKQPFFMGWVISPEYSSYFIAGITLYLARRDGYRLFHAILLGGSLAISSVYAYDLLSEFAHDVTHGDRLMAVGLVWACYIVFLLLPLVKVPMDRSLAALSLGGITYPLYLLHNRAGKAVYDWGSGSVKPLLLVCMIAAAMLLASWAIHNYLERRIADRLKFYLFASSHKLRTVRNSKVAAGKE